MKQPEQILLSTDRVKNLTTNKMKKFFKTLVFVIGVDVLGFPKFHRHFLIEKIIMNSKYYKAYSKK